MSDEEISQTSTYVETGWGKAEVYREGNNLIFDYPDRIDQKRVEIPPNLSLHLREDRIEYKRVEEGFIGANGNPGRTENQSEDAKKSNEALQKIMEALDVGEEWMR